MMNFKKIDFCSLVIKTIPSLSKKFSTKNGEIKINCYDDPENLDIYGVIGL